MKLRMPRRRRDRLLAGAAALAVVAGAGTWTAASATGDEPAVHRQDQVMNMPGAGIDTSYFTAGGGGENVPPYSSGTVSAAARTTSASRPSASPATGTPS